MGIDATRAQHQSLLKELQEERAAALARISRRLERLLDQLQATREQIARGRDEDRARDIAAYRELHKEAVKYRWYLEVQREAIGLRQHQHLDEFYRIPPPKSPDMAAPTLTTTERAERGLSDLVAAARQALGDTLDSIVLYGSAAEGRLRPASDVNVIFVLNRFDAARMDALGEPVRVAQAAIRLAPMVLLRDEIPHAASAFAVKFADIVRRHRVLHGSDPFADLVDRPRPSDRAAAAGAPESAPASARGLR